MTWREFEIYCKELIHSSLDQKKWRIEANKPRHYADGKTKEMDFHVAEKRRGGVGYVIDCKHFQIATLNRNEIETTLEYKRRCRASGAFMLISHVSRYNDNFVAQIERAGIRLFVIDISTVGRIKYDLKKFFTAPIPFGI